MRIREAHMARVIAEYCLSSIRCDVLMGRKLSGLVGFVLHVVADMGSTLEVLKFDGRSV